MKVIHFHPSLASGGIESMICNLSNVMVDRGVDVTVGTIFAPKESDVFLQRLDKRVKFVSLGKVKEGFSIFELFKIYREIRRNKYDVVHLHGFIYYYVIAILLLHRKVKFFYTVHSDASRESAPWDVRLMPIKRFFFRHAWVKPITISEASRESFLSFYGMDSMMVPNGVVKPKADDSPNIIDDFRFTDKTKVFLHPGRITLAKNQVMLCRAFSRLISEGNDVVLVIAGNNQDQQIFSQIEPLFCDRIRYIGERNDVTSLLNKADAFCLSSIWEGLPITLLEALSVGCIPICTPVGGIINVVKDGLNGFLSSSCEEDDYYVAIQRFLSMSDADQLKMKENCNISFEPYNIESSVTGYLECYKS